MMLSSFNETKQGFETRFQGDWSPWIKISSLLVLVISIYKFSSLRNEPLIWGIIDSLPFFTMAFIFALGWIYEVNVNNSSFIVKKSFLWISYAQQQYTLQTIGRKAGEKKSDDHEIYAKTQEGEEFTLYRANRYDIDKKWDDVTSQVPDQFLKKEEGTNDTDIK